MTSKEILNSEEVEFLLDGGATNAEESTSDSGAQRAATMRGNLAQIDLADIFQTLGMSKMEGVLKVHNPVQHQLVYFHEGRVRILVPQRAPSRRLGQRLVQSGLLDPEQLRLALLDQRREHRPLGAIMVRNGWVTDAQVEHAIGLQITEELFGLFTWQRGEFEFYRGPIQDPVLRQRFDACPSFDISTLLLEVARQADEWEEILATLGSLDEVPVLVQEQQAEPELDELQRAVFVAIDGRRTYRELAELAMVSVFDCARTANQLMQAHLIGRASDEHLLELARAHLEQSTNRNAVMVAQTLRDRKGDKPLELVRALANVLRAAGDAAAAAKVLLEAAQLQSDPELAIGLAREARSQNPRELGVLDFLRTTLLAHLSPDSPEIEEVTLALCDGLFSDGELERVLAIIAEAKELSGTTPAVLMREARALARKKEVPAAVQTLLDAAQMFAAAGQRQGEIEAYDLASRLDRDRKDIRRTLKSLRMTRRGKLIRIGAYSAAGLLILSAGFSWYTARTRSEQLMQASREISGMLSKGKTAAAVIALDRWRGAVGSCQEIEDLQQQIRFVESAVLQRSQQQARKDGAARLQTAAGLMQEGRVDEAFAIYGELLTVKEMQGEVAAASQARLEALTRTLEDVVRHLPGLLPDQPGAVTERTQIEETLTMLRRNVPMPLLDVANVLLQLRDTGRMPQLVEAGKAERLLAAAARAQPLLHRAVALIRGYEQAAERNDAQRRLDPLFKAALEAERQLDFEQALASYRELLGSKAGNDDLQKEFARKVELLTGIVNVCAAIDTAAKNGDFETAHRELSALRRAQPQIPFDLVVRLPVTIETSLPGARLRWNGVDLGRTPLLTTYLPAVQNSIELQLPRFSDVRMSLPTEPTGTLRVVLTLRPDWRQQVPAAIDQRPAIDSQARVFAVDRSGAVLSLDADHKQPTWRYETNDTAGYLSPPILHEHLVLVASLDGTLRALAAKDGSVVWQRPGLPTECGPTMIEGRLALATTDDKLVLLDPFSGNEMRRVTLPHRSTGDLQAVGRWLIVPTEESVLAFTVRDLVSVWSGDVRELGQNLKATSQGLLCVRDDGLVQMVDNEAGAVRWQLPLRATPIGSPAVSSQRLLVTLDDRLALIDLKTGKEIWTTHRPDSGWLGAARLSGRNIVAPTRDGWLLVYGEDQPQPRYRLASDKRDAALANWGDDILFVAVGRECTLYRRLP